MEPDKHKEVKKTTVQTKIIPLKGHTIIYITRTMKTARVCRES
jgi:hypothetical protein